METFHRTLIGYHRFASLHSFVGLHMILPIYIYIYIGGFIRERCQFKKTRGRFSATHFRLRWTRSRRIDAIPGGWRLLKEGNPVKAVFIDRMSD